MPWYKIDFTSGIVNESRTIEYEFSPEVLTDDGEQDLFEQYSWMYENPIGVVTLVESLPQNAKQALMRKYIDEQTHIGSMLAVLAATPIEKSA